MDQQRQIFLRDVLSVLFKRKGLIVTFIILVFAVTFIGNYAWPPTYESSAKLRLMRGRETSQTNSTVLRTPGESVAMVTMTQEDLNSEIELIYSADVLQAVAQKVGLDKEMPGSTGILPKVFRAAASVGQQIQYALALKVKPDPAQRALTLLRESIRVTPVKDSHVMEITCRLGNPEAAQQVLTAVIDEYTKKHIDVFSIPKTIGFFEEQSKRIAEELKLAQQKLEEFRTTNKLVSLDAENTLLLEQYTDARKLIVQLTETESAAQALGQELTDQRTIEILSRSTENPVVTELQLRLLELLLERNRMVQSLGPKHPEVLGVLKAIDNAQNQLKEAISSTRVMTEQKMTELEERLATLNKLQAEADELERDVKTKASAQEYYAQKVEESRVADAMSKESITNIKIISQPDTPANPVRPRKLLNLALALIGGLLGGTAIAFFLEYLDHGLKTPEDVEHFLRIKPLASFMRSGNAALTAREAQRLTALLDANAGDRGAQLLQVCSSVPNEESLSVAKALADAYASAQGNKTLLIDLSDESVKGPGFTDIALGSNNLRDHIALTSETLHTIGRGSQSECPGFVWKSADMARLISELRRDYTRIIFHTPPVLLASDALNLARISDGIVMVVSADRTRREVVLRALDVLSAAREKVLGAVLTGRTQPIPSAIYRRI